MPRQLGPTDRRTKILELWATQSSGKIAKELNISRGTVIGIVNRHGADISRSLQVEREANAAYRPKGKKAPEPVKKKAAMPVFPVEPIPELPDEPPLVWDVNSLENWHCRWPIGDPKDGKEKFGFCGRARFGKSSYCPSHWQRSQPKPRDDNESAPLQPKPLIAAE